MLYLTLRLLHIVAMTTWFTGGLFLPGDARRTIANGGDLQALRDRMRRGAAVATVGAISTAATGLALIWDLGGFSAVPRGIHLGLALGVLLWAAGALGQGGAARRLDGAIAAGASREVMAVHARSMGMWSGIFQTLWTLALAAMVFRAVL